MKKILTLLLISVLVLAAFTGCSQEQGDPAQTDLPESGMTADELFAANALEKVFEQHDTMLITTESFDAAGNSQNTVYEYFGKAEDGSLLYSTDVYVGENPALACDTVNGASYYIFYGDNGRKEYHLDIAAEKNPDEAVIQYSTVLLGGGTIDGAVAENEGAYCVNYIKDYNSNGSQHNHNYLLSFNADTLLLQSVYVEKTDAAGNSTGNSEISISYDNVYTTDERPYDAFINAENALELTVVIDPGTDNEHTKVINSRKDALVSGSSVVNGTYYSIYQEATAKNQIIYFTFDEDAITCYMIQQGH